MNNVIFKYFLLFLKFLQGSTWLQILAVKAKIHLMKREKKSPESFSTQIHKSWYFPLCVWHHNDNSVKDSFKLGDRRALGIFVPKWAAGFLLQTGACDHDLVPLTSASQHTFSWHPLGVLERWQPAKLSLWSHEHTCSQYGEQPLSSHVYVSAGVKQSVLLSLQTFCLSTPCPSLGRWHMLTRYMDNQKKSTQSFHSRKLSVARFFNLVLNKSNPNEP